MREFPSQRAYLILACAVVAFAVYGSLIPFEFHPRPLEVALREFRYHIAYPRWPVSRADVLANILLFVPIGFGLTGGLLGERMQPVRVARATAVVVVVSLAVSITVEFVQVFSRGRIASRHDIVAQTIGTLVGITAWIVAGPRLTRWLRDTAREGRTDRPSRLLAAYVAAWIFVNLAPFNLTYDLGELARRLRTGRITVVPFAAYDGMSVRLAWDVLITTLSAIPLGVFGLVGWQQQRPRHGIYAAFAIGGSLVLGIEVAHIFIRGHSADSGDVLCGWIGVAIGVALGGRLLPADPQQSAVLRLQRSVRWAVVALVAWTAILCFYHWLPFDFETDGDVVRRRVASVTFVPFASHHEGSRLSALNDVLTGVGLSIPLGMLAAFLVPTRPRGWLVVFVAGATALFAVIEAGQLLLPTRVADPTDVLIGMIGSASGFTLAGWLQRR